MSEQTPNPGWGGAQQPQSGSHAPQSWGPPASSNWTGQNAQDAGQNGNQAWNQQQGWQQPGAQAPAAGSGGLGLSGRHFGLAAVIGLAAYLVAAVGSALVMFLQGLALDNKTSAGNFLVSIPTWISGSFGNTITMTGGEGDQKQSLSHSTMGLFVVVLTLLAVYFLGKLTLRKAPVNKGVPRLVLAAVTSLVFFVLMLVLALTVHWSGDLGGAKLSIVAVGALGIIIALLSVGVVAYLAFSPRGDALLPSVFRKAGNQFLEHVLLVGGVTSLIAFFVFASRAGKLYWLSFLEIVPGWGVSAIGTGAAGGMGYAGTGVSSIPNMFNFSTFGAFGGGGTWGTVFSTKEWWMILAAMVMLVIGLVWASLRWRARVGNQSTLMSWFPLAAIYLVGGLLILVSSISTMSYPTFGGKTQNATLMVAGWSFLFVFALGALVEVLSRFVAPAILRAVPGLRGLVGLGLQVDWDSAAAPAEARPAGAPAAQQGWGAQQGAAAGAQNGWGAPQAPQGQPAWGGQAPAQPEQGQPAWGGQQGGQIPTAPQQAQQGWGAQPAAQPEQGQQQGWNAPQQNAEQPQQGWGQPQAQQAPAQQGWGAPEAPSAPQAPQQGWGAPQQNADQGQQAWGQSPAQQGWGAPDQNAQAAAPQTPSWGPPPETAPSEPEQPQNPGQHGQQPPSTGGWGQPPQA